MIASQQPVRSADERETSGASTTAPDKEANNDKKASITTTLHQLDKETGASSCIVMERRRR